MAVVEALVEPSCSTSFLLMLLPTFDSNLRYPDCIDVFVGRR